MNGVGQEVKRIREGKGWIQAKLAVEAGMAPSAVNQIENGKRAPSARSLDKLATALGVEVADLFPKEQASLPFDDPEGEDAQWSLLGYVRPWILLLDDFSEEWEKIAEEGDFSRDTLAAFDRESARLHKAIDSQIKGLKRHQGIDAFRGHIGRAFHRSLLRALDAGIAMSEAALAIYGRAHGEDELARARRRRAEVQDAPGESTAKVAT